MTQWTRAKRLVYLVHRWTGVAACILMALWFVSGVVMLFVGYPKLTPWERLAALPALDAGRCCVPLELALSRSAAPASVREIVLTSIRGRAHYRLREGNGGYLVVDAVTGLRTGAIGAEGAMDSARRFVPGANARVRGLVQEDRWTHSGALNPHRPLYEVQLDDDAQTLVYVSSTTGEVVMDAPRAQRAWNYAGAWLHWLYMFRDRPADPGWSWIVIALSAVGTVTSITGTLAGIWRWRFSGRYKSGSRSPYREPYLRWHHISGLLFAAITFTWIFSGLMSMNPGGIFDARGPRPDIAAYRGGTPGSTRLALDAPRAIALLEASHFKPSELEWRVLDGKPYLLARDAADSTRLVVQDGGAFQVLAQWPEASLVTAATKLLQATMLSHQRLEQFDAYYYGRQPEAMMGASERRLPALRVRYGDAGDTWVYLDPHTGDVALSADRSQRLGRWLFSFLHSWDLPPMLRAGVARDTMLILLSAGGLVLCLTGIVIGYARVRTWVAKARKRIAGRLA